MGAIPKATLDMALTPNEAGFAGERYYRPTVISGRERARFFPRGR